MSCCFFLMHVCFQDGAEMRGRPLRILNVRNMCVDMVNVG